MNFTITEIAYQSILAQAQKDAPIESCGYLLGPDKETATENYPMTNIDHSEEHFSFDPKEQFAVLKYARQNGLKIRIVILFTGTFKEYCSKRNGLLS